MGFALSFFKADVLLSGSLVGEDGLVVFVGDGKVALGDDVHSDDKVVVAGWGEGGLHVAYDLSGGKSDMNEIDISDFVFLG